MQSLIMSMILGVLVWSLTMVIRECEVTEFAVLVAVFWASFMCHYVAFYNYIYRGFKMGRRYKRFPNPWEILIIAVNMWLTIASFLEFWRKVFGWQFEFMAEWVAVLCVGYEAFVIVLHFYWSEIISILMCHSLTNPTLLPTTSSPKTTITITTDTTPAAEQCTKPTTAPCPADTPPSE